MPRTTKQPPPSPSHRLLHGFFFLGLFTLQSWQPQARPPPKRHGHHLLPTPTTNASHPMIILAININSTLTPSSSASPRQWRHNSNISGHQTQPPLRARPTVHHHQHRLHDHYEQQQHHLHPLLPTTTFNNSPTLSSPPSTPKQSSKLSVKPAIRSPLLHPFLKERRRRRKGAEKERGKEKE